MRIMKSERDSIMNRPHLPLVGRFFELASCRGHNGLPDALSGIPVVIQGFDECFGSRDKA